MKVVQITYNPYDVSTEILVDGVKPKLNSNLNFTDEGLRLTEWADLLPNILLDEYSDSNYKIEFIGSSADYLELKSSLAKHANVINVSISHIKVTPYIDEVEKNVYGFYQKIKDGPVAELKDERFEKAFQNAKSQKLEIGIVAAMSSGKSTLINALLGKKLMPVAAKATTSTIVKIVHCEQKNYHAIAFNEKHVVIEEYDDVTYQQMKVLNANDNVAEILIEGRIPCVPSVGMELVLIDTPGPNNSRNPRHKNITEDLLKEINKKPSLVLFVQNAANLNTTDESGILNFVSKSMSEGNKHSRDRYIFAVNINPKDDSVVDTLKEASEELGEQGILLPNIFPVSAQVAFENRSNPEVLNDLPLFKSRCKTDNTMHLERYYEFSHLPLSVKKELEDKLSIADETSTIDIHSGIVSIEEAIKIYVNKYARTIKIKDLVEAFKRSLQDPVVFGNIEEKIKFYKFIREIHKREIEKLKNDVDSGEKANLLSYVLSRSNSTEGIIQSQEAKLDWLRDMRKEVNVLITF